MARRVVRASTIEKQREMSQLQDLLVVSLKVVRKELRKALLSTAKFLNRRLRRVFRKHNILSPAMQARILATIPRLTRMRAYCRELGLPVPE